jgi:T5orf172 domain
MLASRQSTGPAPSAIAPDGAAWFVYLLALVDCSAFKVGFSCNPLQRIYSFSRRYYERFDLRQSRLLPVRTEGYARVIEAALKTELAEFRSECPAWVPAEAGGHTEWFSAVYFGQAEERLRSFMQAHEVSQLTDTADYVRAELDRLCAAFEPWAWSQAQHVCDAQSSPYTARTAAEIAGSLRDWLDAYRYFDVPLFKDDPAVLDFVTDSVRSAVLRTRP